MNYLRMKTCKECPNANYFGCGRFFCKVMEKMVIVSDVPSEYHFECIKTYGRVPLPIVIKRVGQYTKSGRLLKVHNSVKDAADDLGIEKGGIYRCVGGRSQSYHGFKWKYVDTEEKVI